MPSPRASKLIPFAKIDDDQALRIVRGFCCAESIPEIADETGVSGKTCRSVVLPLRARLLEPAFDRWREAGIMRVIIDMKLEALAEAVVYGCMAKCYFKRDCYKNFQRGRKQARDCRTCPIKALEMGDHFLDAALHQIDLIETFYAAQGLGRETGIGKLSLFRLRLVHTQVVGEAYEATRKLADGAPDFSDTDDRTAQDLYQTLVRDIKTVPLNREPQPVYPDFPEFEDLSFLDG